MTQVSRYKILRQHLLLPAVPPSADDDSQPRRTWLYLRYPLGYALHSSPQHLAPPPLRYALQRFLRLPTDTAIYLNI